MKRRTFIKISIAGTDAQFLTMSFLQACQYKMGAATLDSEFLDPPHTPNRISGGTVGRVKLQPTAIHMIHV